jgi:diguanylate cyclase (GGDEF)-like protein
MTKPRVLMIVDTVEVASLDLRGALDNAGYATEFVLDSQVTLDQIARIKPDLIFLHIDQATISRENPYQVLQNDKRLKTIPVIVLAAYKEVADQLYSFADVVLVQPVSYERLTNLLSLLCSIDKPKDQTPWEPITGFYTPSYFIARLNQAIQKSLQDQKNDFIVFSINLDQLKQDENTFGQEDWQRILHAAARVIKKVLRITDIISRFEPDKFLVLIEDVVDNHAATSIADRVQRELDKFLISAGIKERHVIGIGVLYGNGEYKTADEVLHDTQLAVEMTQKNPRSDYEDLSQNVFPDTKYFVGNKSLFST